MAIGSIISSLLGALSSTSSSSSTVGGQYSGYINQPQQQSMLSNLLDFKGKSKTSKDKVKTFIGGDALGLFGRDDDGATETFDPYSIYSDSQLASIYGLESLASTGEGAGISLGKAYEGDLGAYDLTTQSQSGLDALQSLLSGAYDANSDLGKARATYTDLADTTFDPSDPKSGYAAFSRALAKAGDESSDVINREQAMTGNRFGTGTLSQKADLAENLQNQRQMALANLYQNSQSMMAAGAAGLTGLSSQIAQLSGMNVNYGDLQRQMEDKKAEDAYADFSRQQAENYTRIGLMNSQWQNPMGEITYTA